MGFNSKVPEGSSLRRVPIPPQRDAFDPIDRFHQTDHKSRVKQLLETLGKVEENNQALRKKEN